MSSGPVGANLLHVPERLLIEPEGAVLASRVIWATSAWSRMRGLIGKPMLGEGEALILVPAPQIHTFGMAYAVGVVFCDSDWQVVRVVPNLRPWRVSPRVGAARYAIELGAGAASPDLLGRGLALDRY